MRGRATNGALAAFPIGQVAAALLGLLVVPNLGWRSLFLIGTLPLLLLFLVRRRYPKSVRYLLSRGRAGEAERTIDAIERSSGVAAPSAGPVPAAFLKGPTGVSILKLRLRSCGGARCCCGSCWSGNLWAANGMVFMLPTILTQRGLTLTNA